MRRLLCCLLAALGLLLLTPGLAWAQVHQHENEAGVAMVRSLESLRDLDYDSWQAVATAKALRASRWCCAWWAIPENCGSIIR